MSEGRAIPIELSEDVIKAFISAPIPQPTPSVQLLTKREHFAIMALNGLAASFPGAHERTAHSAQRMKQFFWQTR